jgi:antitoxin component of MazEF toxin-antitoxin module
MKTLVQKWGSTLAVKIPADLAAEAAIHEGDEVDITIRPVQAQTFLLDELLAGIRSTNLHTAVETGDAQGREAW